MPIDPTQSSPLPSSIREAGIKGSQNLTNAQPNQINKRSTNTTPIPDPTNNLQTSTTAGIPPRPIPQIGDRENVSNSLNNLSRTQILFSIERLISLLFELAITQRKERRVSRMADADAAEQKSMQAADDIRDEAKMEVIGASVNASTQIAGAATVVAGGIRTAKTSDTMAVSNKMMSYQAVSQSFGSLGTSSQGGLQYEAKQDQAQKVLHDANAATTKSVEDSDHDSQKDEDQLIQSIVQLREKQEESRHEAMRATA